MTPRRIVRTIGLHFDPLFAQKFVYVAAVVSFVISEVLQSSKPGHNQQNLPTLLVFMLFAGNSLFGFWQEIRNQFTHARAGDLLSHRPLTTLATNIRQKLAF